MSRSVRSCAFRSDAARTLGVVLELADRSELEPERLAEPDAVLPSTIPADLVDLARWMADEYCSTPARALGLVLAPGATEGVRAREVLVAALTEPGRAALAGEAALSTRQREILAGLEHGGEVIAAELGTASLRRLEARGLVAITKGSRRRVPARHHVGTASAVALALTGEQQAALARVNEALRGRRRPSDGGQFLLHGVTGSGKTEVYLQAVQATLEAGRSAIVLVPEIALTPQAVERFRARFGDIVAVMHSALGQGERYDEWQRLRCGEASVCVGPRSAVFAPLSNIGLIVVDEEHEASYKHEGDPRYDARTVAERRAEGHGAVLLLGSATPRPESALGGPAAAAAQPRRPPPASACGDPRHARAPSSAPSGDENGPGRPQTGPRQGDRAPQPARLVELSVLPVVRRRCGCARTARSR